MKVIGTVARDEMPVRPRTTSTSPYVQLAQEAIDNFKKDRVTVILCDDDDELKVVRNNVSLQVRRLGYGMRSSAVTDEGGTIRLFLDLKPREEPAPPNGTDESFSLGRLRSHG